MDQRQWHPAFAWLPVNTTDGQRVWLERVERRYRFSSWWDDYYEYRLLASVDTHPKGGDSEAAPALLSGAVGRQAETPKDQSHA